MKKIAIIIVNYKNDERTKKFVSEELSKIKIDHVVVIVNNEADEDSNRYFQQKLDAVILEPNSHDIDDSYIYVINNPENSGFARGNNIGAKFAIEDVHVDYILFSNNDIRFIDNDVVEKLVDKMSEMPTIGIIGPKVLGLNGEHQSPEPYINFWDKTVWMYISTPFLSKQKKITRFKLDYAKNAKEGFHYKLMGSFFIVRKHDFQKCGMFDENTFLYAEEVILKERMKNIGKYPYYYPSVGVIHEHGATTGKHISNKKRNELQYRSMYYYYKNYMHTPLLVLLAGRLCHKFLKLIVRN